MVNDMNFTKEPSESLQSKKDRIYDLCVTYFIDYGKYREDGTLFLPPTIAKKLSVEIGRSLQWIKIT